MRPRVPATSASTGVPWIGKKRIRCSGGGSSTMSTTCSSSVRDVRSSRRISSPGVMDGVVMAPIIARRGANAVARVSLALNPGYEIGLRRTTQPLLRNQPKRALSGLPCPHSAYARRALPKLSAV